MRYGVPADRDDGRTDHPDLAEQNEKHKQDQLQKQKEGRGHWKPELASNSEESVGLPRLVLVLSGSRFRWNLE